MLHEVYAVQQLLETQNVTAEVLIFVNYFQFQLKIS